MRRASYTAREKLDAANALEATKDVARVIKERYPDLSASAYESRRKLVLKWLRNKPKIEMQCSLKNGSSNKKARSAGVGTKLPLEVEKELVVWVNDLRKDVPKSATSVCQPADVVWNFPFKARLRAYWVGYLREQLRAHNSGNKCALTAPDRAKVSKWVSMAWDEMSSTTIANGYKKAFGPLLDDADIAVADLFENLSRHCAIDADIGEVDSDDDIEVNEVDEE
ncbi:hypothetical protein PC113_g17933 [Phytophthora cactorum]|uniref:DDE-1 domain-containing protein n=1 Tax=Phytophthora cactorum TaxID=29920 RepID=A0A8T1BYU9_9STRA|nr:hypothetical protein PC113_g17933 [Phytophthora cactorum]KAG2885729.1 hypothetical protein PC114_g19571 [Phytophthora cactorum]KAG2911714.1 hypothetical protein PC117_g19090 [Phytophthora cactorum]KAG3021880.1 hypothetical protein PC120_g8465 [Phytophthora cactorum]KAG3067631.1 hypothetical protein PC121_g10464 [Phytophthora cactorum]